MKVQVRLVVLMFAFAMSLPACHSDGGSASNTSRKGGEKMKTYYMGRFAIDVPVEMKQAVQAHRFRGTEVEDFLWPTSGSHSDDRSNIWQGRISEIKELHLPPRVKKSIIEELHVDIDRQWNKGIFYYGNYMTSDEGTWSVLLDAGGSGLWLKYYGLVEAKDKMRDWVVQIAKTYVSLPTSSAFPPISGDWYYLQHGAINLPYRAQESTYSRFEGQGLDMKLEVDMNEVHEVEELSMAQRLAASIVTRFVPGVGVEKVRSRNRTVAGLKGEELVMRLKASGEDTQIQFAWEYRGEVESGKHPEIQVTLETPDGNLEENLKIWDAILNSFKPTYSSL
jgi:hypothetical protein